MSIKKMVVPYIVMSGLVLAGCLLISPAARAGDAASESSLEIHQLLSQVKTEAIALEHDADVLAMWAGTSQVSWQSHSKQLEEIKHHINESGQLLARLNEARGAASPWQQQAIDRINSLLKEMADNTEITINHFNDNQAHIQFAAYKDYARAGYNLAKELAAVISDYVDYGDHEAEFHRLQEKLGSTAS